MAATTEQILMGEPGTGKYVAVQVGSGVKLFCRDDQVAADVNQRWPWFPVTEYGLNPHRGHSWQELVSADPLAIVGEFVNRQVA